ncbi:MAG: anion permease [Bacillota bacterium]
MTVILLLLCMFFAMNIGASNAGAVMAGIYKGKVLSLPFILVLFVIFAFLGASLNGHAVIRTIGTGIVPDTLINPSGILITLLSATITIFIGNLCKIPLSTSQAIVSAIAAIGISEESVDVSLLSILVAVWILTPILSFAAVYSVEKFSYTTITVRNPLLLKWISIGTAAYMAYATGANNAANAVGPLVGAGILSVSLGALLGGLLIGIGGIIYGGVIMKNVVKRPQPDIPDIVSTSRLLFINATMMLILSLLGIPAAMSHLAVAGIWGMDAARNGVAPTISDKNVKKILLLWILAPVCAFSCSFLLYNVCGADWM